MLLRLPIATLSISLYMVVSRQLKISNVVVPSFWQWPPISQSAYPCRLSFTQRTSTILSEVSFRIIWCYLNVHYSHLRLFGSEEIGEYEHRMRYLLDVVMDLSSSSEWVLYLFFALKNDWQNSHTAMFATFYMLRICSLHWDFILYHFENKFMTC